jgi:hypothetical protein
MKRLVLPALLLSSPAFAHEGLMAHSHPHADYGLALLAVVALVAVGALVSLPKLKEMAARKRRDDSR